MIMPQGPCGVIKSHYNWSSNGHSKWAEMRRHCCRLVLMEYCLTLRESSQRESQMCHFYCIIWWLCCCYPGSEVPERQKSEKAGKRRDLWQNATSLCETTPIKWESPESGLFYDWLVEVQTVKRCEDSMQNMFKQRKKREKKRPVGMANDFDFQMPVIYVVF